MASDTSNTIRRERAIRDTRRRLALVEIETHRIKAELARLEAENEHEWAAELAGDLGVVAVNSVVGNGAASAISLPQLAHSVVEASPQKTVRVDLAPHRAAATPRIEVKEAPERGMAKRRRKRRLAPAWMMSLGVHAAVLALLAPMTYIALSNDSVPLFASMFSYDETHFDPGVVPVEMVAVDEFEIQEPVFDATTTSLTETVESDFAPVASSVAGDLAPTAGQLNALPTDVGTLMAGGGSGAGPGAATGPAGKNDSAGGMGSASFFGTPVRANRIVFLVDNSGSMKYGRMETTLFELARSIDALDEKQEFYVVFYSDKAYPMLYPESVMEPLAATKENKERLYAWLQTVELCQGGALLKAMEFAKGLKPHAVYILSDGDITGTATMQRLTQSNNEPFSVHTLGMGVNKPQDAQNLAAIAQANRGTFQMVRPLPAAVQSAKLRPIRSNERGVGWGEGFR